MRSKVLLAVWSLGVLTVGASALVSWRVGSDVLKELQVRLVVICMPCAMGIVLVGRLLPCPSAGGKGDGQGEREASSPEESNFADRNALGLLTNIARRHAHKEMSV